MNSGHDLGGMHGFGAINAEPESTEPAFHADWERRAFAVCLSMWQVGAWPSDRDRYAVEQQHPVDYLRNSYYKNWLEGLDRLLVEYEVVSADELRNGKSLGLAAPSLRQAKLTLADVAPERNEAGADVAPTVTTRYAIGDTVRVVNRHPLSHTRAPRYIRGRLGTIEAFHGAQVFADKNAEGISEVQAVYAVRFAATELWGSDANPRDTVFVDLWEEHLETAG